MKYLYMLATALAALTAALLVMATLFHATTGRGLPWSVVMPLLGVCGVVGWFCSGAVASLEGQEDVDYLNSRAL